MGKLSDLADEQLGQRNKEAFESKDSTGMYETYIKKDVDGVLGGVQTHFKHGESSLHEQHQNRANKHNECVYGVGGFLLERQRSFFNNRSRLSGTFFRERDAREPRRHEGAA